MKNRMLSIVLLLFTACGVSGQVPSYVPTNGLVGYWPFNGNANDESGNGNNGTVNGATLTSDRFGISDRAYSFDGVSNVINITGSNTLNSLTAISISSWIFKQSNSVLPEGIFGPATYLPNSPGYFFRIVENRINLAVSQPYTSPLSNQIINIGQWVHVIGIYDGNSIKFFLNGVLDGETIVGPYLLDAWTSSNPLTIGQEIDYASQNLHAWNGSLDEIGIWNRALTADEVLALYNGCNVTAQVVSGNTTPSAFSNSIYTCNNNAGSTYTWTVNNGVIVSGQGTNSVTILWGAEGVGSVTVAETTADGCVGDEVIYDVNVQCVVSGNEITGPVGPEAFSNSTYTCNGAANSTYNWTVTNGVIASGQGTNTVNVLWASTGIGNVSVVETTAEGCVGTTLSQDVVVIPVNVEELSNAFIVYPNPVTTELNLQTTTELIGKDLVIFDALGKQIMKQQILSTNTIINTSSFAAGNYVVKIGEGVKRFEVIK
jgi:hypothetical protein